MALEGARRATAGDVPALAALVREGLAELAPGRGGSVFTRNEAPLEPLDAWIADSLEAAGRAVWSGTFDDAVVGVLAGRVAGLAGGGALGVIDAIVVHPEARGVGVGEAMMELALAWFRAAGCEGVDAHALPGARSTKNFFEESGFTARLLTVHHRLDAAPPEEAADA